MPTFKTRDAGLGKYTEAKFTYTTDASWLPAASAYTLDFEQLVEHGNQGTSTEGSSKLPKNMRK